MTTTEPRTRAAALGSMVRETTRWQLPLRVAVYGALLTGLAGCVTGLVVGLVAYG